MIPLAWLHDYSFMIEGSLNCGSQEPNGNVPGHVAVTCCVTHVTWCIQLKVSYLFCPIIPLTWRYGSSLMSDVRSTRLCSRSRDSHVLRDTRDVTYEGDSPWVALSYDTTSLALRLSVNEKWPSELCTKLRFRWPLTSHKSKTKPKFKNPAWPNLDIVP